MRRLTRGLPGLPVMLRRAQKKRASHLVEETEKQLHQPNVRLEGRPGATSDPEPDQQQVAGAQGGRPSIDPDAHASCGKTSCAAAVANTLSAFWQRKQNPDLTAKPMYKTAAHLDFFRAMVKGVQQNPAARSMKKPAGAMKKPAVVVFPITPKFGKGLRAMRRPERRDVAYTSKDKERIRRDRQRGGQRADHPEVTSSNHNLQLMQWPMLPHGGVRQVPFAYPPMPQTGPDRCEESGCSRSRSTPSSSVALPRRSLLLASTRYFTVQMFLHGNSMVSIRMNLGLAHASIERFIKRLRNRLQDFIFVKQETFVYGSPTELVRAEVDEVTVCKWYNGQKDYPVSWISYVGLVQRGVPTSLKLIQLPIRTTVARAPGPGSITKDLWLPIARKAFSTPHMVCLHTDSARAYNDELPGVPHVHQWYTR
eukprot:6459699-Amphidinium_carterae.2